VVGKLFFPPPLHYTVRSWGFSAATPRSTYAQQLPYEAVAAPEIDHIADCSPELGARYWRHRGRSIAGHVPLSHRVLASRL